MPREIQTSAAAARTSSARHSRAALGDSRSPGLELDGFSGIVGRAYRAALMKLFRCDHCSNVVYFENTVCEQCGHALGYWYETNMLVSLEAEDGRFSAPVLPDRKFVYCANAQYGASNWQVA